VRLPADAQVGGFCLQEIWRSLTPHLGPDCQVETEILLLYFAAESGEQLRGIIERLNEELHGTLFRKLKQ
jgi:hypothetical protein